MTRQKTNRHSLTTLYIIRHAESIENVHYTNSEIPLVTDELGTDLSELGIKQARNIAQKFNKTNINAIFSSDFIRSKRTAEIIGEKHKLNVTTTRLIREQSVGSMKGKMTKEVHIRIKKLQEKLNDKDKMKIKLVKDMESDQDTLNRFIKFIKKILPAYKTKAVIIVTHEHLMRMFLIHIGFGRYDDLPHGTINNTGYLKVLTDGINFYVEETSGINKQKN